MQSLITINKSDLIKKFGVNYVSSTDFGVKEVNNTDNDKPKFIIQEVIGCNLYSFDDDEGFNTPEEAFENRMASEIKEAKESIVRHEKIMKRFVNKWFMFKYHLGLIADYDVKKFDEFISEIDKKRDFIQNGILLSDVYKPLPDTLLIPEHIIEPDTTYYLYEKSYSFHVDFKITPVKLKHADISVYNTNEVFIGFSVDSSDGDSSHHIHSKDVREFNGDYFSTGHSEHFVFIDKAKCVEYLSLIHI